MLSLSTKKQSSWTIFMRNLAAPMVFSPACGLISVKHLGNKQEKISFFRVI